MSLEIESRALGALMAIGSPCNMKSIEALMLLTPNHFATSATRNIFRIIKNLADANERFDLVRMLSEVTGDDTPTLDHIAGTAYTTNLLLADTRLLTEKMTKALILEKMGVLLNEVKCEPLPAKACALATEEMQRIIKLGFTDEKYVTTAEDAVDAFLSKKDCKYKIIKSGIHTIDDALNLGGFKESCLITVAGRSGMGKTCFATHLAHNLAANHPAQHILFFSLEMDAEDIFYKQLTAITGKQIDLLDTIEKQKAIETALRVRLTTDTKPSASIEYIEVASKVTHFKTPISVIVVDYLGIVQNNNRLETHVLKQADIAARLAALAKQLNCIVIALTQVNRDYNKREDKCPITADAADSSGSERSSDYWFGIHRPEVDDPDDYNLKNMFVLGCRKDRYGLTWKRAFAFNWGAFSEIDQSAFKIMSEPKKQTSSFKEWKGVK